MAQDVKVTGGDWQGREGTVVATEGDTVSVQLYAAGSAGGQPHLVEIPLEHIEAI